MARVGLLTPNEVADALGVTVGTLNNLRYRGEGPDFIKLGHRTIRYRQEDIEAWIESRAQRI